ncbi:MAG: putative lipid II flippase FtsW [Gammaproteobacteria bacterium]
MPNQLSPQHIDIHGRSAIKSMAVYDRLLLFSAIALLAIGLLMVASSSMVIAEKYYQQAFYFFIRQLFYLGLGLAFALMTLRIEVEKWQKASVILLFITIILLVLVLIPGIGRSVNGSMRWIKFAGVGFQVSELAKLFMVVYFAGYLLRHHQQVCHKLIGFLKPILVLLIVAALLLKEPDFGAMVVIVMTALGMMFLAGVRIWQFLLLLFFSGAGIAFLAISSPYRMARMTAFLDPWADQFNTGYQLTQSLIAFGRGGWFGEGIGSGIQKLFYLPEAHTDFLFAVLAEELGFLGVLIVIGLFTLLVSRAFVIGRRAMIHDQPFAGYLAYGIGLWLGLQALFNMGVNVGLLPTKGLTLPLMSYGGNSLLVMCVVIALLLRIDHETRCHILGFSPNPSKRGYS